MICYFFISYSLDSSTLTSFTFTIHQGMYLPWLDVHHHTHLHYVNGETNDTMPALAEHEEEEEEEEEEE